MDELTAGARGTLHLGHHDLRMRDWIEPYKVVPAPV